MTPQETDQKISQMKLKIDELTRIVNDLKFMAMASSEPSSAKIQGRDFGLLPTPMILPVVHDADSPDATHQSQERRPTDNDDNQKGNSQDFQFDNPNGGALPYYADETDLPLVRTTVDVTAPVVASMRYPTLIKIRAISSPSDIAIGNSGGFYALIARWRWIEVFRVDPEEPDLETTWREVFPILDCNGNGIPYP